MINEIKVKPTIFKGIKYRSRLEARWAVFFDSLNIIAKYEHEKFNLIINGQRVACIPDFYIPIQGGFSESIYFEIRPKETVDQILIEKVTGLANLTKINVAILNDIPIVNDLFDGCIFERYFGSGEMDESHGFGECDMCGMIGFEYTGRSERFECKCQNENRDCSSGNSKKLIEAFFNARNFRFEDIC